MMNDFHRPHPGDQTSAFAVAKRQSIFTLDDPTKSRQQIANEHAAEHREHHGRGKDPVLVARRAPTK